MILVIDKSYENAATYAGMFRFMGILATPTAPEGALHELSEDYRAIILFSPERVSDIPSFVTRLRKKSGTAPIFAVADGKYRDNGLFDAVFTNELHASPLVQKIGDFCKKNALPEIGSYRALGIEASADAGRVSYKGKDASLTKTEKMILRYLVRKYPSSAPTAEILKHSFHQSRAPLLSAIRTHIHAINKKLAQLTDEVRIENGGEGYALCFKSE